MARYNIPITYAPGGVNYNLPTTLKSATEAREGLNFDISPSSDLIKRSGFHMRADDALGYGLALHENREPVTISPVGFGAFNFGEDAFGEPTSLGLGVIDPQLVGLDDVPQLWTAGDLSITYSGTGTASVSVRATTSSTLELVLTEDGSAVLTQDLGDGTESSPYTMASLDTAIDAISDFAAATTGTNTTPAAFLDLRATQTLTKDVPHAIDFGYWAAINSPITTPLAELANRWGRNDFENPTTASMNSILYINDGFDAPMKYDGQNIYKAGLPAGTVPTTNVDTLTASAAGMNGVYLYKMQYRQVDNMNLSYEGAISSASVATDNSAGPYEIEVTVTNLQATTGFNTQGAYTVGAHSSTNVGASQERINVDDTAGGDHTLQVGDKAYFYNNAISDYAAYNVVARTSSTITLEHSATITVSDNMPISNNLRIEIWRTEAGGSTYKLLVEIPNDSFNSTQEYADIIADDSLGANFSTPTKTPGLPTACKYTTVWKNQLIMAGDPLNPNRVYYSEFDGTTLSAENFPAVNFFESAAGASGAGAITGLGVLGEDLIIFTETRCFWGAGNLVTDTITLSEISDNVGCVAHHTIQSIDNTMFFLSHTGVYALTPGGFRNYDIQKVSSAIDPVFMRGANNDFRASYKRAVAVMWPEARKYLLYMPDAEAFSGEWYSKDTSRVWVYNIDRGYWHPWDNIDALGGMLLWDDDTQNSESVVWFHTREFDSAANAVKRRLYKFNHTDTEYDQVDHVSAIDMSYEPQWEFLGAPRIQKLFTELAIDAFRTSSDLSYTPTGTITVGIYSDFDKDTEDLNFDVTYLSNDAEMINALPRSLKRSIGLKFSNNTVNKQILISGWAIEGFGLNNNIRR